MAYINKTDIENVLSSDAHAQLTDDVNGTTVPTAVLDFLIAKAESEINFYLRGKHSVPFTTVPNGIKNIAVDLYIYFAYSRRLDADIPQVRIDNWKDAVQKLKDINAGKILIDDLESTQNTQTYYKTNKSLDDRIFSDDALKTFPFPLRF